ncbi:MAG: hypothetical protein IJ121_00240 [Eubacterium sp.]|nr:hypothetical protein [Eubacterium sp.]
MINKKNAARSIALGLTTAIAATASPCVAPIPVFAADAGASADSSGDISKEDTVYIMADPEGNETDTTVSSHLILDGAAGAVEDASDLNDIINVKGDETFTDENGTLVWDANGQDIYYQGKTDKASPVKVHLTFLLDGKEIAPEALKGKSGSLTIRVQYENDADVTVAVNGTKESVKSPFLMMTGIILPPDTFANVTVDNGRVVNTGSGNVVIGYGMPGLKDSLKLADLEEKLDEDIASDSTAAGDSADKAAAEQNTGAKTDDAASGDLDFDTHDFKQKMRDGIEDLNISDTFEIHADVTDFSLGSTYTFAMSDLFSDLTTKDFLSVDSINEAMDKIKEAGTKLVDGSGELFDGTTKLQNGYGKLDGGIKTLHSGVGELASGSGTLKSGVKQYVDGVNTLADGVTSYVGGAEQLAEGIRSLSDLQTGIDQLKTGLDTLQKSTDSSSDLVKGVNALNSGMGQLQKAADSIDVNKISQLVQAGKGSLDAAGVDVTKVLNDFDGLESTKKQADGLITQIETLKKGIVQAGAAIQEKSFNGAKGGAKQVTAKVAEAGIGGQVGAAVGNQVKSQLPESLALESIPEISVDLSGLSEEERSKVQEQINAANAKINAANGQIQQAQGTYQAARGAVGTAADTAANTAADTVIQNIQGGIDANVIAPDFDPANIAQLTGGLDQLSKKAQEISTTLGNVINSASYQALKAQLPELKNTLNSLISSDPVKKLGTLQSSVDQLAGGTASLKKAIDGKLVPGVKQLDDGAAKLSGSSSKGIKALQNGAAKLTGNDKKLKNGAKEVKTAGTKLFSGADALVDGILKLQTGSDTLSGGSDTVKEGIGALHDGADQLHSGLVRLDREGIQKLADLTEGDLNDLVSRVKAVLSEEASYSSFTGAADGMSATTKFVIETAAIE